MFSIVSLNFNCDLLAWSLGAEVLYAGQAMVQVLKKQSFLLLLSWLFEHRARICKRLRSPGIASKESNPGLLSVYKIWALESCGRPTRLFNKEIRRIDGPEHVIILEI
jgi:hypothetical protein